MKKSSLLFALLLFSFFSFSQKGISYQAVILDPNKIEIPGQDITGQPYVNGEVWVKFNINLGTTLQFEEIHKTKTDSYGLVNLVIGSEANSQFNALIWDSNQKSLQVYVSFNQGNSYTKVSDQKLFYVPYALNAESASKFTGVVPISSGGTGATNAPDARANLGLVIGKDVQAPLTAGVDYLTPAGNAASATIASNISATTNSSLTSLSNLNTVGTITKGVWNGSTIAISNGGTGATNAIDALNNLGAASIESPTFKGTPSAPNPSTGDNSTQIATTAFVNGAIQVVNQGVISSYVPYTGANKPVDLGAFDLKVNGVDIGIGKSTITDLPFEGPLLGGPDKYSNTIVGKDALSNNLSGVHNVAFGAQTLKSNALGYNNTAIGFQALYKNTNGNANTAVGPFALFGNTNGGYNIANGAFSMQNNITGSYNIASGVASMYNNNSGEHNIANGYQALYDNNTGNHNIATGYFSLGTNRTGSKNIGIGYYALLKNTSSDRNISVGDSSLINNLSGDNVAIGHKALKSNSSGIKLTALGNDSDVSTDGLINATAIGNGAIVSTSNSIQLGNSIVTNVSTNGALTTGSVTYPITHGTVGQVLSTTGSGTLTWTTVAGLPYSGNTAGEMLYWNGSEWVKVAAGSNGQTLSFYNGAPVWTGTISYVNTVRSATGRIWMDRNLGASQVATSSTDAASFGDLYQWGRGPDGHQIRTSATTTFLSSLNQPGGSNFITPNSSDPADWRSPQNVNLWQGVSGVNNPCPFGFRIPTEEEWEAERLSWTTYSSAGAMVSPLKLPMAGNRVYLNGSLNAIGLWGEYWSSTVKGTRSADLFFSPFGATMDANLRAQGGSVRCIKD